MMEDSFGSLQDFQFIEMPQTSHSARSNKVLARSRNTVSMSALAREESNFQKELSAALGNNWQTNCGLTSSERFRGFVDTLCRSRSSPAVFCHQKPENQPEVNEIEDPGDSNITWNRLDDWIKMVCMIIIISVFIALMQGFGIL